ncbi:MAG: hypothetical protein N2234_04305 [Planctomycetota bacterium]|nr:hypothetical protein [Planctomycetota bacterium]
MNKLKKFVEDGGYIFSEDWVLTEFLQEAWGHLVRAGQYLRDQKVDVYPAPGATAEPLMRGVFVSKSGQIDKPISGELLKGEKWRTSPAEDTQRIGEAIKGALKAPSAEWVIDDESPWIEVMNKNEVLILMRSKKLASDANVKGNDTVAFTFKAGKGRILHVLSHFGRQNNAEGDFDLQNLLLNFLMEAYRVNKQLQQQGAGK